MSQNFQHGRKDFRRYIDSEEKLKSITRDLTETYGSSFRIRMEVLKSEDKELPSESKNDTWFFWICNALEITDLKNLIVDIEVYDSSEYSGEVYRELRYFQVMEIHGKWYLSNDYFYAGLNRKMEGVQGYEV